MEIELVLAEVVEPRAEGVEIVPELGWSVSPDLALEVDHELVAKRDFGKDRSMSAWDRDVGDLVATRRLPAVDLLDIEVCKFD